MFKKILVALDLLDSNESVFEKALSLAVANGSELMLLHALAGDSDGGPRLPVSTTWDYYAVMNDQAWSLYQDEWQAYEQLGLEALRRYVQRANQAGVVADFTQTAHRPGPMICDFASHWGADVIVVGSHGRRGLRELFLGSVSNYVTHHALTAVLVVRLDEQPSKRVATKRDATKREAYEKMEPSKTTVSRTQANQAQANQAVTSIEVPQADTLSR